MRTTVHLPDDLLKRAKKKAAAEGRTLTSLIEEGLRVVLGARPAKGREPPAKVRISQHSGGLLPGVDLTHMSDIQEQEDLAYAERLRKGFE